MDGDGVTTAAVAATSLTIQLGKAAAQNMTLTIKSFDPRTAVKQSARMDVVNPATGAIICWQPSHRSSLLVLPMAVSIAPPSTGALGQDRVGNDNT